MTETSPPKKANDFRRPIDLGAVRSHRWTAVRHRLGSFAGENASESALLALWTFALNRPQMYFDPKAAAAVRDTLQAYAAQDGTRLAEILEELKPRLDAALYQLAAVNAEEDDGRFPDGGDPAQARAVDERFVHRHLRLLEYVVDPLTLPVIAFHCEKRARKSKTLAEVASWKTGVRLSDHLPQTPIDYMSRFWRPVIRNASAHGGVSHTHSGLRFEDDKGNSEEFLYREFIRHTDRLLDACNGAVLGYTAFLLQQPAPPTGSWSVPMSVAREALSGLLDQPDFRLAHLVPQPRVDNTTLLNLHFDHRLVSRSAILVKAYRAAFAAMDVLPDFDFYNVVLHSPEVILSFVLISREDMLAYDAGEIDLAEFYQRCDKRGQLVWDTQLSFPRLRHKWRLYRDIAQSQWAERKGRQAAEQWSEKRAKFKLIAVTDCSTDTVKKRTAAAALDALPGKTKQLQFPDLAEELVKAAAKARVELPATARKAARRRGPCDRLWVTVFSRCIRPRDAEGCGFADPYLFTVEYSTSGDFQKVKYIDHDVHEFEEYRVSIKNFSPSA